MYGLHFNDAWAGRLLSQSGPATGLAIPGYNATSIGGGLPIWNPPNSGVGLELVGYDVNYVSGTATYGALLLMGAFVNEIGSGMLCSAFAKAEPLNAALLPASGSKV